MIAEAAFVAEDNRHALLKVFAHLSVLAKGNMEDGNPGEDQRDKAEPHEHDRIKQKRSPPSEVDQSRNFPN